MTLNLGMVISGDTSGAQREITQLADKTRKFGTTTNAANSEASRSFKQLKASIDPVYRAELNLKRTQDLLTKSVREGVTSQAEATRVMNQYAAATKNGAVAVGQMSRQMSAGVSSQRRMGLAVQNSSYQFADLAVQIDGGVDPMRAVGQQLPQLLGGFGVLGAVLGAVVAVGLPLSRVLFGVGDAASAAVDPVEALASAQDTARQSLAAYRDLATASAADIERVYGGMTQQVRDHISALQDLRKEQAFTAIIDVLDKTFNNDALDALNQAVKDRESSLAELQRELAFELQMSGKGLVDNATTIQGLRDDIASMLAFDGISQDFGIPPETIDSFLALRDAIEAAVTAGDFKEAQAQVGELRSLLQEVPDGPLKDMIEGVLKAEDLLIKAGFAAGTIAPEISNAADQADRLAGALRNAQAESFLYSRRFADEETVMNMPLTVDPRNRPHTTPQRHTGGGGSTSATAKQAAALKKLTDRLKEEIELTAALDPVEKEMIKLRGQMKGATEAERDAVRALIETRNQERDALAAHITQLDNWRQGARSAFDTIVEGARQGKSAMDTLLSVLFDLGSKLTSMAGDSLIDALFGKTGSAVGGAIGGGLTDIFSNIFKFANGDVFDSPTLFGFGNGQLGVMGEAGREGVLPLEHSFGSGIGVKIGNRETALPLTRLNSGKLGASIQPFAKGGAFGGITTSQPVEANTNMVAAESTARAGGGVINNYWNVSTDSPKSFAESRATTARAANRLMNSLGRYS